MRRTRGEATGKTFDPLRAARFSPDAAAPGVRAKADRRTDGFRFFGRPTLNELLRRPSVGRFARLQLESVRLKNGHPSGRRSISADGSSQQLVQRNFTTPDPRIDRFPCRVSVSGTPENMTVTFHNPGSPAAELDNAEFYIYLGSGERRIRFAGRPRNATMREYLRVKTNAENGGDGDLYHQTGRSVPLKRQGENVTATLDLRKLELDGEELDSMFPDSASMYVWEYNPIRKLQKCNDTWRKTEGFK